jgi:ribonuclease P protein component
VSHEVIHRPVEFSPGNISRLLSIRHEAHLSAEKPQASQEPRLPSPHGHSGRSCDPQGAPSPWADSSICLIGKVRGRSSFQAFRTTRQRTSIGPIRIAYVSDDAVSGPCVAFAIGRRVGGAVVRNRLRRRLRSVLGELAPQMEPGSYLVSTSPAAAQSSYDDLRATMTAVIDKLQSSSTR